MPSELVQAVGFVSDDSCLFGPWYRWHFTVDCRVMSAVHEKFRPEAIVCQCGADGVAGDPLGSFNLRPRGLSDCVRYLMDFQLPLVLLGGGTASFLCSAFTCSIIHSLYCCFWGRTFAVYRGYF